MSSYGMTTLYEETGSRSRSHGHASSYDSSSRRHYSRRERSPSPLRVHSPRGRSPILDINQRVYDDFVSNDYSRGYDRKDKDRDYWDDGRSIRSYGRDRRRSRSRSNSRSKEGSRSRGSRDLSRDRWNRADSRERRRNVSDTNVYDDYRSERSSRRRNENEGYRRDDETGRFEFPHSSTVIVQNLGPEATEQKIEDHLRLADVIAKSISVIRDRTGVSKGYAFVEFDQVSTAEKWIQVTKRNIVVDGRSATLDFSKSKKNHDSQVLPDWHCSECDILNFGSRKKTDQPVTCFKCGAIQRDAENSLDKKDRHDLAPSKCDPCNVLMLRGMSFTTTEEQIRNTIAELTKDPIYDVRLIRDKVTDMSRGFAFVEFGTPEHATTLLETIDNSNPPFEIDMRRITAGYARYGYNAPLSGKKQKTNSIPSATVAQNAVEQGSAANADNSTVANAEYSSQGVADSYSTTDYNAQYYSTQTSTTQYDAQQQQHYQYGQTYGTATGAQGYGGTYDPTTGYYYDATTGLYYDPTSGYHYNGTTGQFLFWNGSRYQAVNQDGTSTNQAANQATPESDKTEPDKDKINVSGQKPKNARKIAKDMERWAKKMNNATEAKKSAVKQAQDELKALEQKEEELRKKILEEKALTNVLGRVAATKDGVRSMFVPDNDEEGSVLKLGSALSASGSLKPNVSNLIAEVPAYDDDDDVDESKFIDTVKMACLLCKRQFPNKEVLTKHLQISQLHLLNLEKYKKTKTF